MLTARVLRVVFTWLGIETLLALFCLQYGLILIGLPGARYASVVTTDLAWQGYGAWLAAPYLLKTVFTGSGVVTNLSGWRYSWVLRFCGAFVGLTIWVSMLLKYLPSEAALSFGTVVVFNCAILSFFIMVMSYHDFPEPRSATDAGVA